MMRCRGRGWLFVSNAFCGYSGRLLTAVSAPTPKDCVCPSALQAVPIATSLVAKALWCDSGVVVDGNTEWSSAEIADSLVCFAACGYGRRAVTAVSTPTCCLAAKPKGPCVSSALQAPQIATRGALVCS